MLQLLHIHTTLPVTPKLFIMVNSLEGSVLEVTLLDVFRYHRMNIGALVVGE